MRSTPLKLSSVLSHQDVLRTIYISFFKTFFYVAFFNRGNCLGCGNGSYATAYSPFHSLLFMTENRIYYIVAIVIWLAHAKLNCLNKTLTCFQYEFENLSYLKFR